MPVHTHMIDLAHTLLREERSVMVGLRNVFAPAEFLEFC